jgi:hypothetical protein
MTDDIELVREGQLHERPQPVFQRTGLSGESVAEITASTSDLTVGVLSVAARVEIYDLLRGRADQTH